MGRKEKEMFYELLSVDNSNEVTEVWKEYAPMLYRIAFHQMQNKSDAEDITQEVFLRLMQGRIDMIQKSYLKAWLIRVTKNCCYTEHTCAYRKHRECFTESLEDVERDKAHRKKLKQREDEEREAEEKRESARNLWRTVSELKENYREVIYLFYFQSYSIREISQILKVTECAAKARLIRARSHLKILLGQEKYLEVR